MRHVDLSLLRSFLTVVDAGGFTAAEKRIHRTQSTISQHVMRLESQLGATLLLRSRDGVVPTDEGERVLAYARRLLSLESEMTTGVTARRKSAVVRLGITDDFAQLHLAGLLQRVRSSLPHVQLRVSCDLSIALRNGLAQGAFDLALYKRTRREGAGVRVLDEPIHWVAARGYAMDRRLPLPLVLFPRGCVYRQRALACLDAIDQPWTLAFESPSTVSVQAAVQSGLGIATLTPSATPSGCRPLPESLPKLGSAELVYEFGSTPTDEAGEILALILAMSKDDGAPGKRKRR